jgi:putative aldouronate transport system permease protein
MRGPSPARLAIGLVVLLFAAMCLVPFLIIASVAFTDQEAIVARGFRLVPSATSLQAWRYLFEAPEVVGRAYGVTILVTAAGTALGLLLTLMMSYALSRRRFAWRNAVAFFMFVPLLFNGGLIPWFLLCRRLGLYDNLAALIVPTLLNAWFVFLLRNFLATLPDSLEDSARVDGAGEFRILFTIMAPLALPGIATVALFITLSYWNDWFLGLMLIERADVVPIQLMLLRIMRTIEFFYAYKPPNTDFTRFPSQPIRMALCLLSIGPIVFAFPFFQRYFVRGLTVGALKG